MPTPIDRNATMTNVKRILPEHFVTSADFGSKCISEGIDDDVASQESNVRERAKHNVRNTRAAAAHTLIASRSAVARSAFPCEYPAPCPGC